MKKITLILLISIFSFTNAFSQSVEEDLLNATNSMKKLLNAPNSIPHFIVLEARAIIIIPASIKVGFFLGIKYGEGIASVKTNNGDWSYPFFIKLTDGSLGFQLGVEKADSILIFRTQNSVNELLRSKFTLGAGASASAGPIGVNYERNSEVDMSAEIFSYSQTSGLFAGASVAGSSIETDNEKNRALYGNNINVEKIVNSKNLNNSYSVNEFLKNITQLTK